MRVDRLILIGLLSLAGVILPEAALAQSRPDTLDWHRYYPLQVGNVWEYWGVEVAPLIYREIYGDTTVDGRDYFLMLEAEGTADPAGWRRRTLYARYDTAGTVVLTIDPHADTTSQGDAAHPFRYDLRRAFGDSVRYGDEPEAWYRVEGGYQDTVQIGVIKYPVDAVKRFVEPLWYEAYATDIGFVGGGNLWGMWLTYAKVDGREYGMRQSPDDTGPPPPFLPISAGNEWTYYSVTDPPGAPPDTTFFGPFRVEPPVEIEGNTYYYLPLPHSFDDTLRVDRHGNVLGRDRGVDRHLYLFNLEESAVYEYVDDPYTPGPRHHVQVDRGQTVETAAGRFEGGVKLTFHLPGGVDDEIAYTFAPGVGLVHVVGDVGEELFLYRAVVDGKVISSIVAPPEQIPAGRPMLHAAYPNPVRSSVELSFELPAPTPVRLVVYDLLGRRVALLAEGLHAPGLHGVSWQPGALPAGVYAVRLEAGPHVDTRLLTLVR